MNRLRLSASVTLLASAALLTACASSAKSGAGASSSASSVATTSGTSATSTSSTGGPAAPAELAALLQKGLQATTSLHLDLAVTTSGQQITGAGDESIAAGKLTAADISETIPSAGTLRLIIVNTTVYVMLPASLQSENTTGKAWVVADPNSTNPVAKQIGSTTASIISQSSIDSYSVFVTAADSVKLDGSDTINGQPASHYSVIVNVAKLPDSNPAKQALVSSGLTTLPIELWVDGQGRLVQLTESLTIKGTATSTKIAVSKYNEPVTIAAPPASEVGTP